MEIKISSLNELREASQKLLSFAGEEKIFLFFGEMGAGKTTLIKALCEELQIADRVSSPTFSIVNEYQSESGSVYHFDFYRLKAETEALDLGYEDYFYSGHYCFIEWPEKIPHLLPEHFLRVGMEVNGVTSRTIYLDKQ